MKRLRIIVRESDIGAAANVGGPVNLQYRTFDIDAHEVIDYLEFNGVDDHRYQSREVLGSHIVEVPDGK
jgi:hypothetical protein